MFRLAIAVFSLSSLTLPAQPPAFEVASVKPNSQRVGHDGTLSTTPGRFVAGHATLKRLICEAYTMPYPQIQVSAASRVQPWIDADEFDIDARASGPATAAEIRQMLQSLLAEEFHLQIKLESAERKAWALVPAKGGARVKGNKLGAATGNWRFHGELSQFGGILSLQLAIPQVEDPGRPSRVTGAPIPVIDLSGLTGEFDIAIDLAPEVGLDPFTMWQRALREQLGLTLELRQMQIPLLTVVHAERPVAGN